MFDNKMYLLCNLLRMTATWSHTFEIHTVALDQAYLYDFFLLTKDERSTYYCTGVGITYLVYVSADEG